MKTTLRFIIAVFLSATIAFAQPTPPANSSVTANTSTGLLVSPTTFFSNATNITSIGDSLPATGTGNFVRATSPTITTPTIATITAPATTNLTLSGGSTGASLVLGQGASGGASVIRNVAFGDTGLLGASWGTGATAIGRNGNDKVVLGYLLSTTNGATIGAHNSALGAWTDLNYNALQHTWRLSEAAAMRLSATNGNLLIGGTGDITGTGGLKVFGTTAATNTTSGALQVAGGIGVSGAGYFGGRLNVSSAFSIPGRFESSDINASIQIHSTATGANSAGYQLVSGGTGSVAGAGGFGIYDSGAGAIRMTIAASTGAATFSSSVTASSLNSASLTAPAATNLTLSGGSSGASLTLGQGVGGIPLFQPGSTPATNYTAEFRYTTGSFQGPLISRSATDYMGAILGSVIGSGRGLSFWKNSAASTTLTEGFRLTDIGNLLIGGTTDITGSGGLKVFGSTAASGYLTGALQVLGGAGLNGALWADGTANSALTGSGLVVRGGNTTFSTNIAEFRIFGGTSATTAIAGDGSVRAFANVASTNTTTGSIVVGGGIGVSGAGWFGGSIVAGTSIRAGGVAPASSLAGYTSVELGQKGNGLFGGSNDNWWTTEAYYSTGFKYASTAKATAINSNAGNLIFKTSAGGAADGAITWVDALTIANSTGAATFSGQANFQSTFPQIVFGVGSTAVNQIGFLYSSGGQYVGLSGNRNPNSGVFANTLGTHASMDFDTGAGGSSITFRTSATPNTLGTIALTIASNQAATFSGALTAASGTMATSFGGIATGLTLNNASTNATAGRGTQIDFTGTSAGTLARIIAATSSAADNSGTLTFQTANGGAYGNALTLSQTGTATFSGDVALSTAGKTLSVKSGTNALAGTVTLASGAATITSSAIDVNTVIVMSVKTLSGTVGDHLPSVQVFAGSAVIDGSPSDNSTYNWVALKVN